MEFESLKRQLKITINKLQIPYSLSLHGKGLLDFGAKDLLIDTKGYRRLLRILSTVKMILINCLLI